MEGATPPAGTQGPPARASNGEGASSLAFPRARAALAFHVLLFVLATVGLATSVVDVAIPALTGRPPFGLLLAHTDRHGPAYFAAHVFLHNLGIAALVPGLAFFAMRLERDARARRLIPSLLLAASVVAVGAGVARVATDPRLLALPLTGPLLALEAQAVLALAFAGHAEARRHEPGGALGESLAPSARRLALPFLLATGTLAVAAWIETIPRLP